jgi:hypothetical protein
MMNRRTFLGIAALSVSGGLLAACSDEGEGAGPIGAAGDSTPAAKSEAKAIAPTPTLITPEELAKVSTETGEFGLTVKSRKDPATPKSGYELKPEQRLVALEVEFENLKGADPMDVDPQYALVTDVGDVTYAAEAGSVDNEIAIAAIKTGEKASGWLGFAVPKDAKLKDLTYRIGLISTITLIAPLADK